jgi:hypothetical protein
VAALALKLLLTPLLIGGATLVARRWGPLVGGWIIALPLTSGPVLFFLALDHGAGFASAAAVGSLAGLAAIAAFCVGYAAVAGRLGRSSRVPSGWREPGVGLAGASLAFAVAAVLLQPVVATSIWLVLLAVLAAVTIAARLIPRSGEPHAPIEHPWWDLPARMVVATTLVVTLTAVAPLLGPGWSGLVATFPVYLSVMAAFAHRHVGPAAANDVLRGMLAGLYGTAAFYVVLNLALLPLGIPVAFAAAIATALVIDAATLRAVRPLENVEGV